MDEVNPSTVNSSSLERSRFGRARKPKNHDDFYSIDDAIKFAEVPSQKSPSKIIHKSPELKVIKKVTNNPSFVRNTPKVQIRPIRNAPTIITRTAQISRNVYNIDTVKNSQPVVVQTKPHSLNIVSRIPSQPNPKTTRQYMHAIGNKKKIPVIRQLKRCVTPVNEIKTESKDDEDMGNRNVQTFWAEKAGTSFGDKVIIGQTIVKRMVKPQEKIFNKKILNPMTKTNSLIKFNDSKILIKGTNTTKTTNTNTNCKVKILEDIIVKKKNDNIPVVNEADSTASDHDTLLDSNLLEEKPSDFFFEDDKELQEINLLDDTNLQNLLNAQGIVNLDGSIQFIVQTDEDGNEILQYAVEPTAETETIPIFEECQTDDVVVQDFTEEVVTDYEEEEEAENLVVTNTQEELKPEDCKIIIACNNEDGETTGIKYIIPEDLTSQGDDVAIIIENDAIRIIGGDLGYVAGDEENKTPQFLNLEENEELSTVTSSVPDDPFILQKPKKGKGSRSPRKFIEPPKKVKVVNIESLPIIEGQIEEAEEVKDDSVNILKSRRQVKVKAESPSTDVKAKKINTKAVQQSPGRKKQMKRLNEIERPSDEIKENKDYPSHNAEETDQRSPKKKNTIKDDHFQRAQIEETEDSCIQNAEESDQCTPKKKATHKDDLEKVVIEKSQNQKLISEETPRRKRQTKKELEENSDPFVRAAEEKHQKSPRKRTTSRDDHLQKVQLEEKEEIKNVKTKNHQRSPRKNTNQLNKDKLEESIGPEETSHQEETKNIKPKGRSPRKTVQSVSSPNKDDNQNFEVAKEETIGKKSVKGKKEEETDKDHEDLQMPNEILMQRIEEESIQVKLVKNNGSPMKKGRRSRIIVTNIESKKEDSVVEDNKLSEKSIEENESKSPKKKEMLKEVTSISIGKIEENAEENLSVNSPKKKNEELEIEEKTNEINQMEENSERSPKKKFEEKEKNSKDDISSSKDDQKTEKLSKQMKKEEIFEDKSPRKTRNFRSQAEEIGIAENANQKKGTKPKLRSDSESPSKQLKKSDDITDVIINLESPNKRRSRRKCVEKCAENNSQIKEEKSETEMNLEISEEITLPPKKRMQKNEENSEIEKEEESRNGNDDITVHNQDKETEFKESNLVSAKTKSDDCSKIKGRKSKIFDPEEAENFNINTDSADQDSKGSKISNIQLDLIKNEDVGKTDERIEDGSPRTRSKISITKSVEVLTREAKFNRGYFKPNSSPKKKKEEEISKIEGTYITKGEKLNKDEDSNIFKNITSERKTKQFSLNVEETKMNKRESPKKSKNLNSSPYLERKLKKINEKKSSETRSLRSSKMNENESAAISKENTSTNVKTRLSTRIQKISKESEAEDQVIKVEVKEEPEDEENNLRKSLRIRKNEVKEEEKSSKKSPRKLPPQELEKANFEEKLDEPKKTKLSDELGDISNDVELIKESLKAVSMVPLIKKMEVEEEQLYQQAKEEEVIEVPSENLVIDIKDDPLEDVEKILPASPPKSSKKFLEFKDGDLAYAKLGHYPFWPCLITLDPVNKQYKKKFKDSWIYHVRFFGDRGRRSWVRNSQLLHLREKNDLEILASKEKVSFVRKQYEVPYNSRKAWNTGMGEALSLINKSVGERYDFFFQLYASQKEKRDRMLKLKLEAEQVKIEKEEKEVKIEKVEIPKKEGIKRKREMNEEEKIVQSIFEEISEEPAGFNKKTKRSKTIKKSEVRMKISVDSNDLLSDSLSDSDSSSKITTPRASILISEESQTDLLKRNNLFKRVLKEKVCEVCYKYDEGVIRCSGRCRGYYHKSCCEKPRDRFNLLDEDEDFKKLSLSDQIDFKMRQVMAPLIEKNTCYDYTSSDFTTSDEDEESDPPEVLHVAADNIIFMSKMNSKKIVSDFKCNECLTVGIRSDCFVCRQKYHKNIDVQQKCSISNCGKYYHKECLKIWPQTQLNLASKGNKSTDGLDWITCPRHVCHICASDNPRAASYRLPSYKIVRCMKCPATYHANTFCVPAGTTILSSTQIVCPRHLGYDDPKNSLDKQTPPNTTWCFICSKGGDLICCDTCPTSVHNECSELNVANKDTYMCDDCETGRLPLYDEIVWVKLGTHRWWPALILFPNEIPKNVLSVPHKKGEFVVKFCGTHDHHWVSRSRVFLFQEGDKGTSKMQNKHTKREQMFQRAVEEAAIAHGFKKEFKMKRAEILNAHQNKPPPYIKIKFNKPVGNVKVFDGNTSSTTPCTCDPNLENPCGLDAYCLNRLLMTECDPEVCPAGEKCRNQSFEKCEYPPLVPYKTKGRGWGLKTLAPIKKGEFVIEYVGEVIDDQEYQRRMAKMHEQKDDNYYFLKIDNERMIDAGPKGNMARFMNHCCEPNCETQKWTVKGDTRVGLFANQDIEANAEVTFNYNLECVGEGKKICRCGAKNCNGFIGAKPPKVEEKRIRKLSKTKKKRSPTPTVTVAIKEPCFICGKSEDTFSCHNKICTKHYHLKCINMETFTAAQWSCPWHNCNICSKRTIRCCVKCVNSYCPSHSEGNIRHDRLLGFVCTEHDPSHEVVDNMDNQLEDTSMHNKEVTSTTQEDTDTQDTTDANLTDKPRLKRKRESKRKRKTNKRFKLDRKRSNSEETKIEDEDTSLLF